MSNLRTYNNICNKTLDLKKILFKNTVSLFCCCKCFSVVSSQCMQLNLLLVRYAFYESVQILKIYYKIMQSGQQ